MTTTERTALTGFLNLAGDYIKSGYRITTPPETKEQCPQSEVLLQNQETAESDIRESLSSLPLAYQVDEDEAGEAGENLSTASAMGSTPGSTIEDIAIAINNCKACGLAATRKKAVPGEGVQNPLVMVIGEGPGADEDSLGRPFVGKAGQLLDKMLAAINLDRNKNCYIANMVKCRPPENRNPEPEEMTACYPFLEQQILLLRPCLILCSGRVAAQYLFKTGAGINALRGKFVELKIGERVIPVMPTFHPSALLRDNSLKRYAWDDLRLFRARLASISEEYASYPGKADA